MWIRNYSGDEKQVELFRRLYRGLVEGIVHFSFRKNDGSVRSAYGTLDGDIICAHVGEKSGGSRYDYRNQGLVCYFDLVKNDWRCFSAARILTVDADYCGL